MLRLFPEGFEERPLGDRLELAAYGDAALEERMRSALGPVEVAPVEPGWEHAWRDFHRPVRVGRLWIGPPWASPDPGSLPVVIDPGRAFGTGAHPTTRLGLELLVGAPRGSVLDLGCGSGVLSIAAVQLGLGPVTGLDSDPAAIEGARANAQANGVEAEFRVADVVRDPLPQADLALANIALEVVERLATRVDVRVLIASGYLARDRPAAPGWRHVERVELDGWAADRLESG